MNSVVLSEFRILHADFKHPDILPAADSVTKLSIQSVLQ